MSERGETSGVFPIGPCPTCDLNAAGQSLNDAKHEAGVSVAEFAESLRRLREAGVLEPEDVFRG